MKHAIASAWSPLDAFVEGDVERAPLDLAFPPHVSEPKLRTLLLEHYVPLLGWLWAYRAQARWRIMRAPSLAAQETLQRHVVVPLLTELLW